MELQYIFRLTGAMPAVADRQRQHWLNLALSQ